MICCLVTLIKMKIPGSQGVCFENCYIIVLKTEPIHSTDFMHIYGINVILKTNNIGNEHKQWIEGNKSTMRCAHRKSIVS